MRKQIVVLEVRYDQHEASPPAEWDWTDLAGDLITVIAAGAELHVEEKRA